ncbi:hypothetical protein GCM10027590_16170 [Nocardiopsis nanhaiensis]
MSPGSAGSEPGEADPPPPGPSFFRAHRVLCGIGSGDRMIRPRGRQSSWWLTVAGPVGCSGLLMRLRLSRPADVRPSYRPPFDGCPGVRSVCRTVSALRQ